MDGKNARSNPGITGWMFLHWNDAEWILSGILWGKAIGSTVDLLLKVENILKAFSSEVSFLAESPFYSHCIHICVAGYPLLN